MIPARRPSSVTSSDPVCCRHIRAGGRAQPVRRGSVTVAGVMTSRPARRVLLGPVHWSRARLQGPRPTLDRGGPVWPLTGGQVGPRSSGSLWPGAAAGAAPIAQRIEQLPPKQ